MFKGNVEIARSLGLQSSKIDIHSHVLPQFDDGSRSLEESLEICTKMKKMRYEAIIWTPHYNIPAYPQINPQAIQTHYNEFAPIIEQETGLKVFMGSELYCTPPLPDQLVPLAGTDFVLIEFPYDTYPRYLDDVLYDIQLKGYRIIFAHVERYKWLFPERKKLFKKFVDYTIINRLKEKNIYFQVNQTTLDNPQKFVYMDHLYENDYVEFVGADKHHREDKRTFVKF